MPNSKNIVTIGGLIIVLILAFLAYYYYSSHNVAPSAGVAMVGADGATINPTENVDADAARFLALLQSVKDVGQTINDKFINDKYYVSLQDYTVPVPARPLSRANPFLNIGIGGAYSSGGGAGTGGINLNFSGTSTTSVPSVPADTGKSLSPSSQQDLLKALQQQ